MTLGTPAQLARVRNEFEKNRSVVRFVLFSAPPVTHGSSARGLLAGAAVRRKAPAGAGSKSTVFSSNISSSRLPLAVAQTDGNVIDRLLSKGEGVLHKYTHPDPYTGAAPILLHPRQRRALSPPVRPAVPSANRPPPPSSRSAIHVWRKQICTQSTGPAGGPCDHGFWAGDPVRGPRTAIAKAASVQVFSGRECSGGGGGVTHSAL